MFSESVEMIVVDISTNRVFRSWQKQFTRMFYLVNRL